MDEKRARLCLMDVRICIEMLSLFIEASVLYFVGNLCKKSAFEGVEKITK